MPTLGKRRILLVDDNAAVRHALALVLAEEGVGECREAAGRQAALDAAGRELPDVALVDLSPASEDALELIAELSARNIPVLICSMHENAIYVRRALQAGAHGYITKPEAPGELARAVRDVLEGWMLISPRAAEGLRWARWDGFNSKKEETIMADPKDKKEEVKKDEKAEQKNELDEKDLDKAAGGTPPGIFRAA